MKKIKSPQQYLKAQRKKSRNRLRQQKSHKNRVGRREEFIKPVTDLSTITKHHASLKRVTLKAPEVFSLIKNPEETVKYFEDFAHQAAKEQTIFCDFSQIEDLTTDAIIAMIAHASNPKIPNMGAVKGIFPSIPSLADKFYDSGMFGTQTFRFSDGKFRPSHGTIYRRKSKAVQAQLAQKLIQFSTEKIFGEPRKMKGVYATLIECMNNTFNWAKPDSLDKEEWWATVYCDTDRKIAFFNFLDNGVGILESIKLKWQDSLMRIAGFLNNADVMREVLQGKIGSRSGLKYRGNGLPEIYKRYLMGQISRLIIVANNVYVDVEKDEYRILPEKFKGTFFHWEISYDEHFNQSNVDNFGKRKFLRDSGSEKSG